MTDGNGAGGGRREAAGTQPADAPQADARKGEAPQADARPGNAGPAAAQAAGTGTPARKEGPGRYGLLLLILIMNYLLSAFVSGRWVQLLQVALFVAVALLATRSSREEPGRARLAVLAVIGGSVIVLAVALAATPEVGAGVASIWSGLLALLTVVLIVQRVLSFDTVTLQSIFGALSAYLVIGLMFASIYAAMDHLGGAHFFAGSQPGNTKTFQYFSFTTLTTLGYGDFTAAGSAGRAVAVLEALTGQVFLATLVARLVAAFRPRR